MKKQKPMHGTAKARGCSHMRLGNFCRMLPKLPSWGDEYGIDDQCEAEQIAQVLGGPGGIMHDINSSSGDSKLPAGYTFFAQFVDHDITLDVTSKLHAGPHENLSKDKVPLPNLRSASLDLDCLYGFGPEASPYLFDGEQHGRMLIGNKKNPDDVPRNKEGRALIGDPRNDENIFVSQMHAMFIKFHNRRLIGRNFEEAQRDVRYHYQWIVLKDFLHRICDHGIYHQVVDNLDRFPRLDLRDKCNRICMPLEFSVAAYRFGHTLVRSQYPANADFPVVDLFDERFGTEGFSAVSRELTVDWRYLLPVEECSNHINSKSIDHLLADELIRMPDPIVGRFASGNDRSLAFRNLLRAYALGLPCGQSVANEIADLGYSVDLNRDLEFDKMPGWACLDKRMRGKLTRHTPLFLYLMREAGVVGQGERLGPVGSAIVLEVFMNMLKYCDSFLSQEIFWEPDRCVSENGVLTLRDIVRYVSN